MNDSSNAPTHLELTNTTDTVELDFQAITAALNSTTVWLDSHRDFDSDSTDSTQVFTQKLYNFVDMAIGAGFGSTPTWENKTLQQAFGALFRPAPTPSTSTKLAIHLPLPRSYANAARTAPPAATTPKAAAPTPAASAAPCKRGKKATPTYTRTGPSRHSIMVTFQTAAPAASFSILVARITAALKNSCSSLVIDSACVAFAGWCYLHLASPLSPNSLYNPKPWVGLPASTSYLRIMGALYWSDSTGTVRLTPNDFEAKMLAAPFKELCVTAAPVGPARSTSTYTTAKLALVPPNSSNGTRATAGTPHCMRCHRWGHPTTACMATKTVCAHCAGPHNEANHREAAACCQAKPKANPPVLATLAGVDWPHAPHCVNCRGDNLVTARKCVFFRNRFDREWINARYAQFQYMGGDFNCHSSVWDPVPRAPNVAASHWLLQAAVEIGLELATVANPRPTHIPRDVTKFALRTAVSTKRVIDDQSDSDHIPLLTSVPISPAVQTATRRCLPSDPEKAQAFLDDLVTKLRLIVPDDVADTPDDIEAAAKAVVDTFSAAWLAHSRKSNVMCRFNPWWNETCSTALQQHRAKRDAVVKQAKRAFFNAQIAEIAVKSKRP
ncbi:hypothetical protein D9619_009658 [Psilocybe cf. subviscida]|uniref:Endonuclease/exonuclease/phosphatase domain-containing protein n=1 Tax=Psilocybe cf. subviscida TaxID=2480587 RepID=A0A8H5BM50_9AGAR|nr:hypothetical protein D9619_009658 [Psilocybe cf. subviscida]